MRITNKMLTTNYMTSLNSSLSELTKLNDRVATGRSYLKASEDPATALKALAVRQNLSRIALYQSNVKEAGNILTDAESAIAEINKVLVDASEQIVQGKSDTYSEFDRQILATVFRNYQSEILDIANSKSSSKYIFGGSDLNTMPFEVVDGTLYYHGLSVDENTGFEPESLYYDIGLGLQTDGSGNVIEGTGFDVANPGSVVFGTGIDLNGLPNNVYHLLGEIAQRFETNDLGDIDLYMSKLEEVSGNVTLQYVDVGQKSNFLEFLTDRLETNQFNATAKQSDLEGIDQAQGILDFKMQEVAYNAALAMGSKIIQHSLLDYMT